MALITFADCEEDKLSWMEVIGASIETDYTSSDRFIANRRSVRSRMDRRVRLDKGKREHAEKHYLAQLRTLSVGKNSVGCISSFKYHEVKVIPYFLDQNKTAYEESVGPSTSVLYRGSRLFGSSLEATGDHMILLTNYFVAFNSRFV